MNNCYLACFLYFIFVVGYQYAFIGTSANEVTVEIPPGPAGRYCVDIDIFNTGITPKVNNSFILVFTNFFDGIGPGPEPVSQVTITYDGWFS